MDINVNLQDIPTAGYVPPGTYVFRVTKLELADSKSSPGEKKLNLRAAVVEGPGAGESEVWDNFSLMPDALWRLRDFVAACGVYPGPNGFRTEEMIGRMFRATAEDNEWPKGSGQKRTRLVQYAALN